MFQKVRLRLTALCAGATSFIIIFMSLLYLFVSENGLYENQFRAFCNDMNTITTSLEQQTVISMEWLSRMEAQGNYLFFATDNGVPFLYNQLPAQEESSLSRQLFEEALKGCESAPSVSVSTQNISTGQITTHSEFRFSSVLMDMEYFAGIILSGKEGAASCLQIIVLSPLDSLSRQILEQRLHFFLIDAAAVLFLLFFSWILTGRLLKPIIENHRKQVQFVASASHELRTPLAVILSCAECCGNASDEEKKGFLSVIQKEGQRMSSLINDLLTLSQSDNRLFPISTKPTELDTLFMNVFEAFQPLAKEKSITLSVSLPERALPLCLADPDRISQVLSILLHNAVSYTPEHGKIELLLTHEKERFLLSVRDNGIGISDQDKGKIFDRFFRAEKARSTKGHFGLGLSIAYEIVKSHGGSIRVCDAAGGGSIFTVVLPGRSHSPLSPS